jgi:hypothetical protein
MTTNSQKKKNDSLRVPLQSASALEENFSSCKFIIVDEVSMISTYMLSKMDARMQQAKKDTRPFGGLHVIFFGDFVQYPPVAGSPLFKPLTESSADTRHNPEQDITHHTTGRNLWLQLNSAVFLKQQMRQTDETYGNILTDLRNNNTANIDNHYRILNSRLVGSSKEATFDDFKDATLITTRNAVRTAVNFAKTKSAAIQQQEKQIVILAHDSTSETELTPQQRIRLLHQLDSDCGDAIGMLSLVSGMPLVIKSNLATELGICNGTLCRLSRVVMHENQLPFDPTSNTAQEELIRLMPIMLIVKIENPRFPQFDGLQPGEFPIFPSKTNSFSYNDYVPGKTKKQKICTVTRKQFPVLPAYALTGYTAQGATFSRAILDITPPSKGCGKTNPADTYVLLSRMKTLAGILILRPFPKQLLAPYPNHDIHNELQRLQKLEADTISRLTPPSSTSRKPTTVRTPNNSPTKKRRTKAPSQ